jgi:hypothetical protein
MFGRFLSNEQIAIGTTNISEWNCMKVLIPDLFKDRLFKATMTDTEATPLLQKMIANIEAGKRGGAR